MPLPASSSHCVFWLGAFDFRLSALLLLFLLVVFYFLLVCVFIFAALPGYDFV